MEEKEKHSEHGKKVKAGKLLSQFLREISQELTETGEDVNGSPCMITKAEALVRNMWKYALGYTEFVESKDGTTVEIKHPIDKGMMSRIFDRIEGKVPMTTAIDKQRATAANRLEKENTKRLNAIGGFSATADANRKT